MEKDKNFFIIQEPVVELLPKLTNKINFLIFTPSLA